MRWVSIVVASLFFALMASGAARADGQLANHGTFTDGTVNVELDTYTDNGQVVSLIGMKGNGISISFAFDASDWPDLLSLWRSARAKSGDKYQTAGSQKEVGSSAQCVITMAGGPAVKIIIVDPTAGALVYVVNPSDQDSFENDLREIGAMATKVN